METSCFISHSRKKNLGFGGGQMRVSVILNGGRLCLFRKTVVKNKTKCAFLGKNKKSLIIFVPFLM